MPPREGALPVTERAARPGEVDMDGKATLIGRGLATVEDAAEPAAPPLRRAFRGGGCDLPGRAGTRGRLHEQIEGFAGVAHRNLRCWPGQTEGAKRRFH